MERQNTIIYITETCTRRTQGRSGPRCTVHVDWEILRPGESPFERALPNRVRCSVRRERHNRRWEEHRLQTLWRYRPQFTAVGCSGMHRYVLLHFPERGVYVLECGLYGHATYVIPDSHSWETVSRMTKAQLLSGGFVQRRIVHHPKSWDREVQKLLGQ